MKPIDRTPSSLARSQSAASSGSRALPALLPALLAALLAPSARAGDLADVTPFVYDDIPSESTPFETHYWAGAAWGDVDADGDPDLFITDYYGPNRLYRSEPSLGMLIWDPLAIDGDPTGSGEGAVFADFDNDGDLDLYVVNQGGTPNHLYANEAGSFVDVSAGSGVDNPDFGEGCTAGDVDGDGRVDLFLTNYGDPSDPFNPGAPNHLFLNTGGMTFVDATVKYDLPMVPEKSSACAFVDWDADGDLDLFVGNEGSANHLYENVGESLVDVTASVGGPDLLDPDSGTFGIRWFDADNDGDLDLYVSNSMYPTSPDSESKLYMNLMDEGFESLVLAPSGAESLADGMAVSACDLDLDGSLDLAAATFGDNEVFFGSGAGTFGAAPGYVPEPFADITSSATSADFDMDGDLDLFFGGLGTVFVYENLGDPGRGSTVLNLTGDASAPHAVPLDGSGSAARAKIAALATPGLSAGPLQVVDSGSGYAQDARGLHVGLDLATETIAEVDLQWADGTKETVFGLPTHPAGATRLDVDIAYPAGIEAFGAQSDPTPLEMWRGGAESFPVATLGSTDFGLTARGFEAGSLPFLMYGTTEISLPIEGGDLLLLPIEFLPGAVDGDVLRFSVPIPSGPALEGLTVLFQSLAITPTADVDWSNGVAVTLQP